MVSPKNKKIGAKLIEVIGKGIKVERVFDESKENFVDILFSKDSPESGVVSYSTIGVSDVEFKGDEGEPFPVGLEITSSFGEYDKAILDILADIYFYAMDHDEWICSPGSILRDVVAKWIPGEDMQHAYFTAPFYLDELGKVYEFPGKQVTWVMMIPISQKEYEYFLEHGDEKFEEFLQEKDVSFLELHRASSI